MKSSLKDLFYMVVFLIVIVFLGGSSYIKLVNFYVNKEKDYNEWTPELGRKLETDITSTFYGKFSFINFNGAIRKFLGQRSMNGIVKLDNGYLIGSDGKFIDDDKIEGIAKSLSTFNEYLRNYGASFVYALAPYTVSKYDPQIPVGVNDYANDNADRLIARLSKEHVDVIDFRENMHSNGIEHYSMMYKTDHHWTTEAGLYAYGVIEEYIRNKIGCEVDDRIADVTNYTITRYKGWHLGSRGQRTGKWFAGIDDYDLILPSFQTHLGDPDGWEGTLSSLVNMAPLKKRIP